MCIFKGVNFKKHQPHETTPIIFDPSCAYLYAPI